MHWSGVPVPFYLEKKRCIYANLLFVYYCTYYVWINSVYAMSTVIWCIISCVGVLWFLLLFLGCANKPNLHSCQILSLNHYLPILTRDARCIITCQHNLYSFNFTKSKLRASVPYLYLQIFFFPPSLDLINFIPATQWKLSIYQYIGAQIAKLGHVFQK